MSAPRLVWSDSPGGHVEIIDEDHLGRELQRLHTESSPPIVATIEDAHGIVIGVGLGSEESLVFVHRDREDDGRDEWVTIGRADLAGFVDFMVLTDHHTEFERRHLVPFDTAMSVTLELYRAGSRSSEVAWEHDLV